MLTTCVAANQLERGAIESGYCGYYAAPRAQTVGTLPAARAAIMAASLVADERLPRATVQARRCLSVPLRVDCAAARSTLTIRCFFAG